MKYQIKLMETQLPEIQNIIQEEIEDKKKDQNLKNDLKLLLFIPKMPQETSKNVKEKYKALVQLKKDYLPGPSHLKDNLSKEISIVERDRLTKSLRDINDDLNDRSSLYSIYMLTNTSEIYKV